MLAFFVFGVFSAFAMDKTETVKKYIRQFGQKYIGEGWGWGFVNALAQDSESNLFYYYYGAADKLEVYKEESNVSREDVATAIKKADTNSSYEIENYTVYSIYNYFESEIIFVKTPKGNFYLLSLWKEENPLLDDL